ncbi:MAG: hypothetical protein ABSH24_20155 [Bryobacteraceae bacterium]|jgi:hypothetical protein
MKRATITIGGDLEEALQSYTSRLETAPTFTALVQAALREYLSRRGAAAPAHPLRITPACKGSGKSDISQRHDQYIASDA